MPVARDVEARADGTRFALFPQPPFLEDFAQPETVWVSPPAGTIGPGPDDDRMYVVDPVGKPAPYGVTRGPFGALDLYLPPWTGAVYPPAMPDSSGHFDHIAPGSPGFEAAHLYGSVRRVLDVWEGYFAAPIAWHFRPDYRRLELSLFAPWDNARAGYGFLEVGADATRDGAVRPFALNFDVIAHEVGHLIIYSELGLPTRETEEGEYFGFHESAADLVALVAVLHFDSVVDRLLETTSGNLYTFNELNRFAELSDNEQIRLAGNASRLSDFAAGWSDEHRLAQPLTGAMFDILIDIFHENLLDRGLIGPDVEELSDRIEKSPQYEAVIQPLFDAAYREDPAGFKAALLDARDYLGTALARTWGRLSPHYLNYDDVGEALLETDREISGGRYRRVIRNNFLWRDIGSVRVGPKRSEPGADSHAFSARTAVPEPGQGRRTLTYTERMTLARRGRNPIRA